MNGNDAAKGRQPATRLMHKLINRHARAVYIYTAKVRRSGRSHVGFTAARVLHSPSTTLAQRKERKQALFYFTHREQPELLDVTTLNFTAVLS